MRKQGKRTSRDDMMKWSNSKLVTEMRKGVRADFGGSKNPSKVAVERVVKALLDLHTTSTTSDQDEIEKLLKVMELLGARKLLGHLGQAIVEVLQDTTASARKRVFPYYDEVIRRLGDDFGAEADDELVQLAREVIES